MARRVGTQSRQKNRDFAGSVLLGGTAVAILASWLALDPRSIDAFQDPKVVLAHAGIAAAAAGTLWMRLESPLPFRLPRDRKARIILILFAAGYLAALASALASRHSSHALDTMRSASIFLLALGVGASPALGKRLGKAAALFGAGAALNAVLALLAAGNIYSPLVVIGSVKRSAFGGLLGNAGHLGICLALAGVALLPAAWIGGETPGKFRWPARAGLAVVAAGMIATQTLSGLATLAAGIAVYSILRLGRRAAIPIALALALVASAAWTSRQLRFRVLFAVHNVQRGNWNAALSARAAPWLAAADMVRDRPWLGIGPGNFGREFIGHRLAAEARHHQRLVVRGMANNSFSEAHCDYLDLAAAIGLPGSLCVIASYLLLLGHLFSRARGDPEAAFLGSGLAAGAVAAATWFPFQIVASGVWLLLLAGAGFRHVAAAGSPEEAG